MYGMLTALLGRCVLCTFYLPALKIFMTQDFQFEKESERGELNHFAKETL